jgi:hypothetical protein
MTVRHRRRLVAVGVVLVATACSAGGDDTESVPSTSSATTSSSTTQQVATTTTATTTSIAPQSEPLLIGAAPVIQLTATEGVGVRPTLGWEAVEDADSYFLVVKDDAGTAYWAWDGSETSIPLGGANFPEDFGNGPTIGPGYTWSVSAYSADGTFLAISGDRPISP